MLSMKGLVQEFLFDCQVRNLAPRTIKNYEKQLRYFTRYLSEAQSVETLEDLKPIHIKQFRERKVEIESLDILHCGNG